jgi:hypothetical protein
MPGTSHVGTVTLPPISEDDGPLPVPHQLSDASGETPDEETVVPGVLWWNRQNVMMPPLSAEIALPESPAIHQVNVLDVAVTLPPAIAPPLLVAEHPVNVPDVTVTLPPVEIAPP